MTHQQDKTTLARFLQVALVIVFVIMGAFYSVIIPPGEGVDEIPHFDYVRYVKETRSLPVQPMSLEAGVKVWMGHHAPLYYVLGALVISWTDTSDWGTAFRWNPHFIWAENDDVNGWNVLMHFGQDTFPWRGSVLALHVMRLFTVALGALAVYAIFAASYTLFDGNVWMASGATALMALNPSFVFMSSTIHHDTLLATLFALGAWWLMVLLDEQQHPTPWFYVMGGGLAGLAALTKLSGLVLTGVMMLGVFLKAIEKKDWVAFLKQALLIGGVALLVAGWWYVRNQILYGDPFGWRMFLAIHRHMVRVGPYTWEAFKGFFAQIRRTFWGAFGYMHITFYSLSRYFWFLIVFSVVGLLPALLRKQIDLRKKWKQWLVTVTLFVLLFASFVRFSIATEGAGHARYLFPAAFSMGAVMMTGLCGFTGKRLQPALAIGLAVIMSGYAIYLPLVHLMPKYASPEAISMDELPDQATLVNLDVAQGVRLIAYHLSATELVPSQDVTLTFYWEAIGATESRKDPQIKLDLVRDDGNSAVSQAFWPVPSLSPNVWASDKLFVSRVVVHIPDDEMPDTGLQLKLTPILRAWGEVQTLAPIHLETLSVATR